MRISILLAVLAITILLSSCSSVLAFENDIGESKLHPASLLYFLKGVREAVEFKMAFTPRVKLFRQLEFATRRLREVKSLISVGREDLIATTLEQYWYYINSLPQKGLEEEEIGLRIKESLTIHLETLERIYEKVTDNHGKIAIRSAINRIIKRSDVPGDSKNLACNFLAKEASGSGLTEPERQILNERAEKCYQLK